MSAESQHLIEYVRKYSSNSSSSILRVFLRWNYDKLVSKSHLLNIDHLWSRSNVVVEQNKSCKVAMLGSGKLLLREICLFVILGSLSDWQIKICTIWQFIRWKRERFSLQYRCVLFFCFLKKTNGCVPLCPPEMQGVNSQPQMSPHLGEAQLRWPL